MTMNSFGRELLFFDYLGIFDRYYATVVRTFSFSSVHQAWAVGTVDCWLLDKRLLLPLTLKFEKAKQWTSSLEAM